MKKKLSLCSPKKLNLSRVQTAKIQKTLATTFKNLSSKKKKEETKNTFIKRPESVKTYFSYKEKMNSKFFTKNEINNIYNNIISPIKKPKYSRPNTSYKIKKSYKNIKLLEKKELHKKNLNEIHHLLSEKYKDNKENNKDYIKEMQYKKLIMRAKLLKAMKQSIILKNSQYEEFKEKYTSGNKLLSDKLKNRFKTKIKKNESYDDDFSNSNSIPKTPERADFNSLKHPDIFSKYEFTPRFQDFHCTPLELIKRTFNSDEQRIIDLDPFFFRLNKEPFIGVEKNLRFSLKDKIIEEDRLLIQKIKQAKEKNEKILLFKRKKEENKLNKKKKYGSDISINEKNIRNKSQRIKNYNFSITKNNNINENKLKSNKNIPVKLNMKYVNLFKKKQKLKIKGKNSLGIKVNKMRNSHANINLNTDYNVYIASHRKTQKNKITLRPTKTLPIDTEDETIAEKKKRLTLQELFDHYNERKKSYLDDLSYNRSKNNYKFEKLRTENFENMINEKENIEAMRKIMFDISQNYKSYQK